MHGANGTNFCSASSSLTLFSICRITVTSLADAKPVTICIICSESISQTGSLFLSDRTMSRSLENGSSSIHRPRQEVWTTVAAETRKIWRQNWRQKLNLSRKTLALSRPVHGFESRARCSRAKTVEPLRTHAAQEPGRFPLLRSKDKITVRVKRETDLKDGGSSPSSVAHESTMWWN